MQIPQRPSLVAQVVEILRRGIRTGEWTEYLPSERELGDRLQVSRPTVRAALGILGRERLIQVCHGKKTRIRARKELARLRSAARVVGILDVKLSSHRSPSGLSFLFEVQRRLHQEGFEIETHVDPRFNAPHPEGRLQNLVRQSRATCWVLLSASAETQRWFLAKRIPTILSGSRYADIKLPCIDLDFRAICRHAGQVLLKLGHRQAALITPKSGLAGDLSSEQGFREAFQHLELNEGLPRIVHHDETVEGIQRLLDTLMKIRPAPTAFLVSRATHTLTVFGHLFHSGFHVPREVSLISRDHEEFLSHVAPSIARYVVDWNAYGRRLARAILQLARAGTLAPRETLIFPHFVKGLSLTTGNLA